MLLDPNELLYFKPLATINSVKPFSIACQRSEIRMESI